MVLSVKVLVVLVRFFPELFVKARSRIWLLLGESRFDSGGQVIAKPIYNVKLRSGGRFEEEHWVRTFFARLHPHTDSLSECHLPPQVSLLWISPCLSPLSMRGRSRRTRVAVYEEEEGGSYAHEANERFLWASHSVASGAFQETLTSLDLWRIRRRRCVADENESRNRRSSHAIRSSMACSSVLSLLVPHT